MMGLLLVGPVQEAHRSSFLMNSQSSPSRQRCWSKGVRSEGISKNLTPCAKKPFCWPDWN